MGVLTLSRRRFFEASAVAGGAAVLSAATASSALAESNVESGGSNDVKRVRSCCRACGKMECGVWVTVQNGRAIRVEGDESAFQSMGNCCNKSQSSIQAAYHPDRLYHPMKRTNPKDNDDPGWVRISWEEAFSTITQKLEETAEKYSGLSVFGMSGTSRQWGMLAYGALGQLVGSPNMAIPWQVCKGPRFFGTSLNSCDAFSWQENVSRPKVYVSWGTAPECSNYDDSCRTIIDVAEKAQTHILVDPRMTNHGKEADLWLPLRPGTDDAMALAWMNVVVEGNLYDELFVKKWTNAPYLVVEDMEPTPGNEYKKIVSGTFTVKTRLLKESDLQEDGDPANYMVWDAAHDKLSYCNGDTCEWEGETWVRPEEGFVPELDDLVPGVAPGFVISPTPMPNGIDPALEGEYEVTLKDGRVVKARPVWALLRERLAEFTPEIVSEICEVPADDIREAATIWATPVDPDRGFGNGGIHYQLAIEHACNGVQTARILDTLIGITGNWDVPGGSRGSTVGQFPLTLGLGGNSNGAPPLAPEVYDKALGVDEFPLLKWWQRWADDAVLFKTMETGDPYPLKFGWCSTGDIMNMSNPNQKWEALKNVDFFVVSDLWKTPTAGMADMLLPVEHWIETNCPRISQGSSGAQGATVRCIEPPADVLHDIEIIIETYKRMGVPWSPVEDNPWPSYEEELDVIIADSGMKWSEYVAEFQKHGWWDCKAINPPFWGTYRRYETGYLPQKAAGGVIGNYGLADAINTPGFGTPTKKMELWNTTIETFMPDSPRDVLPEYIEPPMSPKADPERCAEYPFIATSGRRIPVYFHSEHRQLPWCREQWPAPRVEINPEDAAELGIEQGDWVWIETPEGKIRQTADLYYGIKTGVVNLEHQWWFPELDQADKGFNLSCCNCLVRTGVGYQDRISGASYLRAYPVKIYKATAENSPFGNPCPCDHNGNEIIHDASDPRLKKWTQNYDIREEA